MSITLVSIYIRFLIITRRPPLSKLFPYTTLFRSIESDIVCVEDRSISIDVAKEAGAKMFFGEKYGDTVRMITFRSEEHTSELQSRGHIVCRLLLEKKKIQ